MNEKDARFLAGKIGICYHEPDFILSERPNCKHCGHSTQYSQGVFHNPTFENYNFFPTMWAWLTSQPWFLKFSDECGHHKMDGNLPNVLVKWLRENDK